MPFKVEIIAHATEDEELLRRKAEEVFGVPFKIERLEGHWGNPIHFITATVGDAEPGRYSKAALVEGKLEPGDGVLVVKA